MFNFTVAFAILVITIFLALMMFFKYRSEKNKWNQGYCPDCGEEWEYLNKDSEGARLYKCKTGHMIRIFYQKIDQ